jgi:hypothetical protein
MPELWAKRFTELPEWIRDKYLKLSADAFMDRNNLEWLVYHSLFCDEPTISNSKAMELLGFEYMEDLRKWIKKKKEAKNAD